MGFFTQDKEYYKEYFTNIISKLLIPEKDK